jgi:Restriction endonuclease
MSRTRPDWEQLELIIADIQRQLAPEAEVRHDHWVKGRSGRRRKLDITVSQKIGAYPIFIVFDCKRHAKPVKMKDVEAFAGQCEDVKANLGVMISNSGFDAGAKAVAAQKNIILQTYRAAEETDWRELVGEGSWIFLTRVDADEVRAYVTLASHARPYQVSFDVLIFDKQGEVLDNLKELFWRVWKAPESPRPIGGVRLLLKEDKTPFFIHVGEERKRVREFAVDAKLVAKKYAVNLRLAEGGVLEDIETGRPVYQEVASKGFDWAEIMRTQAGVELSPEEYEQSIRDSQFVADLGDARRWLRVVVADTKKKNSAQ